MVSDCHFNNLPKIIAIVSGMHQVFSFNHIQCMLRSNGTSFCVTSVLPIFYNPFCWAPPLFCLSTKSCFELLCSTDTLTTSHSWLLYICQKCHFSIVYTGCWNFGRRFPRNFAKRFPRVATEYSVRAFSVRKEISVGKTFSKGLTMYQCEGR